jgi:hypothetical protein
MAFGGMLAAIAVQPMASGNLTLTLALWLLAGFLAVQCVLDSYFWLGNYVVITGYRILCVGQNLLRSGVSLSLPLTQVQDIHLVRPTAGRLLGYGTLVSESAGITLRFIPYPEQAYIEICSLIFRDHSSDD